MSQTTDRSQQGDGYIVYDYFWRIINGLQNQIDNLSGGDITSAKYQAWMQTLPDYDPDVDDQVVVRMHDGTFKCKIANTQ